MIDRRFEQPDVYQTDAEFSAYPQIRHAGCFFMSIVRAMSRHFSLLFTHERVIWFYEQELKDADADVDNEMFVGNAQDLIDDLVGPGRVKYFFEHKPADYVCRPDEVDWGCWHKTGNSFNHFTHDDGRVSVLYDPWSREGSDSVRLGKLISKRVARYL